MRVLRHICDTTREFSVQRGVEGEGGEVGRKRIGTYSILGPQECQSMS